MARRRPIAHFGAELAKGTLNPFDVFGAPAHPVCQRFQPYFGNGGDSFGGWRTAQAQRNQFDEADDDGVVDFFGHVI